MRIAALQPTIMPLAAAAPGSVAPLRAIPTLTQPSSVADALAMLPADDVSVPPDADASFEVQSSFMRYARWAKPLRSIPGVTGSGWRSSQPDLISVHTRGPGWTKLLMNIIDGDVEGATLRVSREGNDGSDAPSPDGRPQFWESFSFLAQAVSALPGVSDWVLDGAAVPGEPTTFVRFTVTDPALVAPLTDLVRDQVAGVPVKFVAAPR